jgi:acetylornithine deacetylase/succinyl-diaminopimelate desuccinylase-like protein
MIGAEMQQVLAHIEQSKSATLAQLRELIAIPSVSTEAARIGDVRRCAEWLAAHLRSIGMGEAQVISTARHPIVYSEWCGAPGAPTLLVYGHYDVQPPEPLELWMSPPFQATVRDGNLYARGSTDDKGQLFIHFKAIEAYLQTVGRLPLNLKIILEGEEEIGSESLPIFLTEHRELLKADLAVISDTAFFAKDVPSLCYGLRGIVYMQIDLQGPNRDLHSGSYGGSVHNPIQALAEIVAQLHDRDGRVTVGGFSDDVRSLAPQERQAFRRLPWRDEDYRRDLGVEELHGEKGFTTLERLWARPTLECNGIVGGFTAEGVKSVIPSRASAKISMRLVPDQSPDKIASLFEQHIRTIAPRTVQVNVRCLTWGEPSITPLDSPGVRAALAALRKGFSKEPLFQRDGGSIPVVAELKQILGIDTVLLGFGLPDENAHAPDEFLSLDNFFGGIRTVAHFYQELSSSFSQQGADRH